jgi:hypothetical protein
MLASWEWCRVSRAAAAAAMHAAHLACRGQLASGMLIKMPFCLLGCDSDGSNPLAAQPDMWHMHMHMHMHSLCHALALPPPCPHHTIHTTHTTHLYSTGPTATSTLCQLPPASRLPLVCPPPAGVMGVLQALEAIKVITGVGETLARKLLIFDALSGRFQTVRLRAKAPGCAACSQAASISAASISGYDYEGFTGQAASDGPPPPLKVLSQEARLSPEQLKVGAATGWVAAVLLGGLRGAEMLL